MPTYKHAIEGGFDLLPSGGVFVYDQEKLLLVIVFALILFIAAVLCSKRVCHL